MTITVLLHRQKPTEPLPGTFRAYMLINGRPNKLNILNGKRIKDLENARIETEGALQDRYGKSTFVDKLKINFQQDSD
jgi:hypothetical protein